jgi:hypothetical protein
LKVFSVLNLATLGTICCTSKEWKQLASDKTLWKKEDVYNKAISNKKWIQWFGEEVVKNEDFEEEWASLPWNIAGILESRCPIFPEKRVMDTHMLVRLPKTLNGQLTLKSLGELAKKYFPNSTTGYTSHSNFILNKLEDKPIDKSYWVLMTKDVLRDSKCKSYSNQQKMVADLAEKFLINYEVPEPLEAAVCILSQYFFDSKTYLFSADPLTYTRCKENVQREFPTTVGGFTPRGLNISQQTGPLDFIGIAALWKL